MECGVFVSYSHKDKEEVDNIVNVLRGVEHLRVWYDHGLCGGEQFFDTIPKQIIQNDFFVFVVSEHSLSSEFCMQELEYAMTKKRTIIPVWLRECVLPETVDFIIHNRNALFYYQMDKEEFETKIRESFQKNTTYNTIEQEKQVEFQEKRWNFGTKYFLTKKEVTKLVQGLGYEERGEYSKCFTKEYALLLGLAYDMGIFAEVDKKKAEFYYRVGMHKKDPEAEFLYDMLAIENTGTVSNELAEKIQLLAESGSMYALVYWGMVLYEGTYSVGIDKKKAYQWWETAAEQGNPVAQYQMAFGHWADKILEKDEAIALMYALESSEQEYPCAYQLLGRMYHRGDFVKKNMVFARQYYEKALQGGDYFSEYYLGEIEYDHGKMSAALEHYKKAVKYADEGKIKSGAPYAALAEFYEFGGNDVLGHLGIQEDKKIALEYFLKALQRKYAGRDGELSLRIGYLIEDLSPKERVAYYKKAGESGWFYAEQKLGEYYEAKGQIEEALKWYKTGSGKWNNMQCAIQLLNYYSRVLGKKEYANRTKALDAFGDLFSTWTFVEVETGIFCEEMMPLYTFAYAVELDVCQSGEWRGRQESIKYYRKTLLAKQGMQYWKKISQMAYGFLTANDMVGGILDVSHGIDLLILLEEHLDQLTEEYTHKTTYKEITALFLKGYEKVIKENNDIVKQYKQEDYDIEKRYRIAKQKIEKNLASLEKGHKVPFPTWLMK